MWKCRKLVDNIEQTKMCTSRKDMVQEKEENRKHIIMLENEGVVMKISCTLNCGRTA
jgi:hypothetical protein